MAAPRFSSVVWISAIGQPLSPGVLWVHGADVERLGLLRRMRVFGSLVDAQIAHLLPPQRAARHHALHRLQQHPLGMTALQDLFRLPLLDAAGIAGMPVIGLVVALVAGEDHL